MPETSRARAYAALATAGCLWGTGFLFGKWALRELSVGHLVFYRFLFATIAFAPATFRGLRRRETRIARRDIPLFFVAALLGFPVQSIIQFAGLARTTVAHASLMVGNLPVLLAAGAAILGHEQVTARRWLALVASTIGAALIAVGASQGEAGRAASLAGDLLVALSLLAGVGWILASQRLMMPGRDYPPAYTSAYTVTIGAAMIVVWVLLTEGAPSVHLSTLTWISVIAPGILATALTNYLWNWALVRVPASKAGVFINLEPVVGAILGVALLGDVLGPYAVFGGVLVIGTAIYVAMSADHPAVEVRRAEAA